MIFAIINFFYQVGSLAAGMVLLNKLRKRVDAPSPSLSTEYPGVSIITSIKGPTPYMAEGVMSLLNQDYPGPIELVVAALDENEMLLPELFELVKKSGTKVNVKYVYPVDTRGVNPRTIKIAKAYEKTIYPWIFEATVDTRFPPDFLKRGIDTTKNISTNYATTFPITCGSVDFAAQLEAVGLNLEVIQFFLSSEKINFPAAYGGAIIFHRELFEKTAGWKAILLYLADDVTIARELHKVGGKCNLVSSFAYVKQDQHDIKGFWSRQIRWRMISRYYLPLHFYLSPLEWLTPIVFLYGAISGSIGILAVATLTFICRIIQAGFIQRSIGTPSREWLHAWTLPIFEFFTIPITIAAFFANTIKWGTTTMKLNSRGEVISTKF